MRPLVLAVAVLVLRHAAALAAAGIALGAVGAAVVAGTLQHMLFSVSPLDPVTFAVAALLLLAVAVLASAVPVYRAVRADPMVALRSE